MQEQQQKQKLSFMQRLQAGTQAVKVLSKASESNALARQVEDKLAEGLEQSNVPAQTVQEFKVRLEKVRQARTSGYTEDIYAMGGILLYCGILLPVLISLGVPDLPVRFAWIAFAIAFPCTIGFFLTHLLKTNNKISSYGWVHSTIAFLAQIGIVATTASLFFHVWNVAGWIFLVCALVIFFGYYGYRFRIYYKPFLGIFRDILKNISKTNSNDMN